MIRPSEQSVEVQRVYAHRAQGAIERAVATITKALKNPNSPESKYVNAPIYNPER